MNNKKIFDFVNKINSRLENFQNKPEEPQRKKISLSNLILLPLGIFLRNWKPFLQLSCIFAPLMAFLAFATKNSVICGIGLENTAPFGCIALNNALYFTFLMLRLLIIVVFLRSWYKISIDKEVVEIRNLLVITIQDWKLFATIMLFFAINLLPLISFVMLVNRVPNPDWRIETLYFAAVSCGFIIPFVAIRFYSYPSFIAAGKPLPSFLTVFKNSADNGLKLLSSLMFIILFCSLTVFYFNGIAEKAINYNKLIFGIVFEFTYEMLWLALMAILMNYSTIQRMELFYEAEPPAEEE